MELTCMNILVTLDKGYLTQLCVMLKSLLMNNQECLVHVYVLHRSLTDNQFHEVKKSVNEDRLTLFPIQVSEEKISLFPTSKRYPSEMYFRLFAPNYLPNHLERILYLDPDIVIINSLKDLYYMPFDHYYFMACSHVFKSGQKLNSIRLKIPKETPYFNSGVILMNLPLLREKMDIKDIIDYVINNRIRLFLPDQDVFTALYGRYTKMLDSLVYNLSDRYKILYDIRQINKIDKITHEWIKKNTVIIHYYSRNKPWKPYYRGILGQYYHHYHQLLKK